MVNDKIYTQMVNCYAQVVNTFTNTSDIKPWL